MGTWFRLNRRWWLGVAVVVMVAVTVACYRYFEHTRQSLTRGEQLYAASNLDPASQLIGRMAGHTEVLPVQATRCSNCHVPTDQALPVVQIASSSLGYGPALAARHLLDVKSRRGGPPSAYDQSSFCRLLREGLDPAAVIIDQSMPRYQLSAAQSEDLWHFLTQANP